MIKISPLLLLLALLLLPACAINLPATGFLDKQVNIAGETRKYVIFIPDGYDPTKPWPLVIFLHGAGERGDDGLIQSEVGIGRAIRRYRERFPCLVVMPQCPNQIKWDQALDHLDEILAKTRREFNVDPARISLTGLSIGGFGSWLYGAKRAATFCALMPVCGWADDLPLAQLRHLPVWTFHGSADPVIPAAKSLELVKKLKQLGGQVRYTEYPGVGHNSWDRAYADPEAIRFLLQK